jgi:hypothetical protein
MSPTKFGFFAFVALIAALFVAGLVYLLGLLFSFLPDNPTIDPGNAFTCTKLGINCDKIVQNPTPGDRILAALIGKTWFQHIAVTSLFMLFGFLAYWCRCRAQFFYGFVEVFAALLFAAAFLYSINVQDFRFFRLAVGWLAAIYVIVRGLDNMEKGLARVQDIHRCWRRFFFGASA